MIAEDAPEGEACASPRPRAAIAATAPPVPAGAAPLEGIVLDADALRKRARDEAFRATPDAIMWRAMNGG